MHRTTRVTSPVVTFFARSPAASYRTHSLLRSLFHLKDIPSTQLGNNTSSSNQNDALDDIFPRFMPLWHWESLASRCPVSGTIIHTLSLSRNSQSSSSSSSSSPPDTQKDGDKQNELALLSITRDDIIDNATEDEKAVMAVKESRNFLASHMNHNKSVKVALLNSIGYHINASHFLGSNDQQPLLKFPDLQAHTTATETIETGEKEEEAAFHLREIVLPYFDQSDPCLQSQLSQSGLERPINPSTGKPVIGLYQWPTNQTKNIVIRPLPAATEDRSLSPPSLIFQCRNLEHSSTNLIAKSGATTSKVGFTGNTGKPGQLRIYHRDLVGIDLRICESQQLSSSFAEAEEALLAGSLDELQSESVLSEGKDGENSSEKKVDLMNGVGDCWTEFRANVKKPSGFFRDWGKFSWKKKDESKGRIAKPPDLPYE